MTFDPRTWLDVAPVIERHGRLDVVRDDLLEGGSKSRFLPFLVGDSPEIVYGSPFCGGAAVALAVLGKHTGQRVTIFYAKRKALHPRQRRVLVNGATIYQVPTGYMTNVQAKARAYAAARGAMLLPLGFDVPAAREPLAEAIARVRARTGSPSEVWCATGSGMLAHALAAGFPESAIRAVAVGLKSRHGSQSFPSNVEVIEAKEDFATESRSPVPFPCCPNYDRKAWAIAAEEAKGTALFWNVMGPG